MGQNARMEQLGIPGYTKYNGISMNVPSKGHRWNHPIFGRISTDMTQVLNHRQLLLRDLGELNRVYGPNGMNILPKGKLTEMIRKQLLTYPSLSRLK